VFGELLTYMEPSRRGVLFKLASGRETSVPPNLIFLATMNSRDKSVQEIDDAFDRRFGKIEFAPNVTILMEFLGENGVEAALARRIAAFFAWVNEKHYPLGHTFFLSVKDGAGLSRLWESQLRFVFEKAFKYEPKTRQEIEEQFHVVTGAAPRP
jgi:5-methylcytosine-specific restriction enzyme B